MVDPRPRYQAFDGLRGFACLVVLLGHSWVIVPLGEIDRVGPVLGLFRSPSLAVTTFLTLGAFLVTRGLLADEQRSGSFGIDQFWMRRLVRLGSQLYVFVIVILVVSWFDRWDEWSAQQTQRSLLGVSTFTFNLNLVSDNAELNRADLGHLWYLSVEQQFYLVWAFVLAWFGRFRRSQIGRAHV